MLSGERSYAGRPTLFFLHYLGGSAREWVHVITWLREHFRCVAIDLPGFGDAAETPGYAVADMATMVERAVSSEAPKRWMLVGHSMGAKVAAVVARRAEDGAQGLEGLIGLVTVAGSPPGPEPMDEAQRLTMLGWFSGDSESNLAEAQHYIAENSGNTLDTASAGKAVADVLRANRAAWRAWLLKGSREDWAEWVGVLETPTLAIAGADDEALGPDAQRRLMVPHFVRVRSVTLAGAKHLLPLECPQEVARSIRDHADSIAGDQPDSVVVERERGLANGETYRKLIASGRVSARTRQVLTARSQPDDPAYEPVAMNLQALVTLRAVVDRVVPQTSDVRIDLAARIDKQLACAVGDGWRFATLPPDAEAYRAGLFTLNEEAKTLHDRAFADLEGALQDAMLERMAASQLGADHTGLPNRLEPGQMRSWFEDLRSDAVRLYVAHPETLGRIGYSGIANGGDGEPKSGFVRVGAGEREAWEPEASAGLAR